MRNLSLFIAIILLTTTVGFSQNAQITESKETMKLGTFNALTVKLPDASKKVALGVWKDFIKSYGAKAKRVKRSKEYLASGAIIGGMNNSEEVDVYAKINEMSNGSELTMWISMGEFYVSSAAFATDYALAQKLLEDYAHEVSKELVVIELEEAEKQFKKMDKEMVKLRRKNDSYHKTIEKAKKTIAKAEKNIEENENDQAEQKSLMEEQTRKLEEIKERLSEM